MDAKILQKWTEYSDEVSKRMTPTEDREDVAPLVAAILTLAEEISQASTTPQRGVKRQPRSAVPRGKAETAEDRGEPRSA
jgi:hypothetical protein